MHFTAPAAPYPPTFEAWYYYADTYSRPILVARSSTRAFNWHDFWPVLWDYGEPSGPKRCLPVGSHPLNAVWETTVALAIVDYLCSKGVQWTTIDPVRMRGVDEDAAPVIVWIGVIPASLSTEDGIEAVTHCKSILTDHGIHDVDVEIRESEYIPSAKMYTPVSSENPDVAARAREPLSTSLGLPICAEATPSIEGTAGFFFSDPRHPGKLYLLTARHVVFGCDEDELYEYGHDPTNIQPRRDVLVFSDAAFQKYIFAIQRQIDLSQRQIQLLGMDLEDVDSEEIQDAGDFEAKWMYWWRQVHQEEEKLAVLVASLVEVLRDWREREKRILGHVVFSPPIRPSVGDDSSMEDWAVIEVDPSKVDRTNFAGNVINLSSTITDNIWGNAPRSLSDFFGWVQSVFDVRREWPLVTFHGTVPNAELWQGISSTVDNVDSLSIVVMKRGGASGLTRGLLNTMRSFTRIYAEGQPGPWSKAVAIIQHKNERSAFSAPGDSGSAVLDSHGRLAGVVVGGAGNAESLALTYLSSIDFLLERMAAYGIEANVNPSLNP